MRYQEYVMPEVSVVIIRLTHIYVYWGNTKGQTFSKDHGAVGKQTQNLSSLECILTWAEELDNKQANR